MAYPVVKVALVSSGNSYIPSYSSGANPGVLPRSADGGWRGGGLRVVTEFSEPYTPTFDSQAHRPSVLSSSKNYPDQSSPPPPWIRP